MYIKSKRLLFETNPDVGMSRRPVLTLQSHKTGAQKYIDFPLKPRRCALPQHYHPEFGAVQHHKAEAMDDCNTTITHEAVPTLTQQSAFLSASAT
jgi:hypothetical protein